MIDRVSTPPVYLLELNRIHRFLESWISADLRDEMMCAV